MAGSKRLKEKVASRALKQQMESESKKEDSLPPKKSRKSERIKGRTPRIENHHQSQGKIPDSQVQSDQAYTPSGVHIGTGIKIMLHKGAINNYTIQNLELAKALDKGVTVFWPSVSCMKILDCSPTRFPSLELNRLLLWAAFLIQHSNSPSGT